MNKKLFWSATAFVAALMVCNVFLIASERENEPPVVEQQEAAVIVEPLPEPLPEPDPAPMYSEEELEMLAIVIYQEAGGNHCCDDCRRRVADVVLNRIADDRYPDTMEEVLTQRLQYGRLHWTGVVWAERAQNPNEAEAVARAYRIAQEVLEGQHSELYGKGYIYQAEFTQSGDTIECCDIYFGR